MSTRIPIEEIKTFFNEYSQIKYEDKGGFKLVYSGLLGSKKEAIKIFILPTQNDMSVPDEIKQDLMEEAKKRIIRELLLLEKSESPYIVKLGNLPPTEGKIDNQDIIYYSEEFLDGPNLAKLIKNKHLPDKKDIITLLICLLHAVTDLWGNLRTVHRDIKPLNIIKTTIQDRPFVLLDLGIAFIINETPLTINPMDRIPPGTTKYLAPEMLNPNFRGNLDFRSDLYTIGITAYEFAAGIHPLARDGDDLIATISRIAREKPRRLQDYRNDLPEELCDVINQLIKKVVALRPSNVQSLIKKLEEMK